ncbi:MAG: radical SAM family heme chaperone HemW [Deltaproteobacteria bacterium]|nr:radical SAM family heme chaperone HemW [Deltaproteobacteria bacterium]
MTLRVLPPSPPQGESDTARVLEGAVDLKRAFGIYVHFPFCGARCPYCDFAIDVRPDVPHERYAQAVCRELMASAPAFGLPPVSIYFGGGTPGLWRPACVAQVIDCARLVFAAAESPLEVTLEANPGEVTLEHLQALRAAGVNRLSFGIQSFDAQLLTAIGRTHSVSQAHAAIPLARAAGFTNVACDLMFGLPGQTEAHWQQTLAAAIQHGADHLSCYALTVEPFTPFGQREKKGQLQRPDDDAVATMWELADATLTAAGYQHYEVSSYARPGARAIHNTLYWTQGAYLGVGCAAASLRPLASGGGWRFLNPRAAETYMQRSEQGSLAPAQVEWRTPAELEDEAVWLALRTSRGLDRAAHQRLFGADPLASPNRAQAAARLQTIGWLQITPTHLLPTVQGLMFADDLATRLWV